MVAWLDELSLYSYVSGENDKPKEEPAQTTWITMDKKARNKIILGIDDDLVRYIPVNSTARVAWEALQEEFESRNAAY